MSLPNGACEEISQSGAIDIPRLAALKSGAHFSKN